MNSFPVRFGLNDPVWLDPVITAVGILLGLIAAAAFYKLLFPLILRLTQWTPSDLDTRLLNATRRPLTVAVLLLGVYLSIVIPLDLDAGQREQADKIVGLLGIVLGVLVVVALIAPPIRESRAAVPIAFQTSIFAGSASAVIATVAERG